MYLFAVESEAMNSKLADQAPGIVGAFVLLSLLLTFLAFLFRSQNKNNQLLGDRQNEAIKEMADKSVVAMEGHAEAVTKLADAITKLQATDEARVERHYEVLRVLGETCNQHHRAQDVAMADMMKLLGKVYRKVTGGKEEDE